MRSSPNLPSGSGLRALYAAHLILQSRVRLPWSITTSIRARSINTTSSSWNASDHDLVAISEKWRSLQWDSNASANSPELSSRGKAYVLPMFPYPSGNLHLGHLRVYTISDVLARAKRMMGYNVLHPIGWDAFGLPAENAAIERRVHPAEWTANNIETMKSQMMAMGGQWDWDKEFRTCDPDFYKHTQRLFLLLHSHGLAYQAESLANWDPVDRTVLANEQVDANGCSWRSGAKVQKKMLRQWFLKITDFKEPLLEDLDTLAEVGGWPERVISMQKNWIGRSAGTSITFQVNSSSSEPQDLCVFTTRADTLLGVQYLALSLKHPMVTELASKDTALQAFLDRAEFLPPDSKEGFMLPVVARNPLADFSTDPHVAKSIPVFVAPYVLSEYGSGAVMGVPGHDTRDYAFWKHNLPTAPVKFVIKPSSSEGGSAMDTLEGPVLGKGSIVTSDRQFAGLSSDQAIFKITLKLQSFGHGAATTNWRLRDWLISRQRYWGAPIPIVHCDVCGAVPVPSKDLPVKLPELPASYFEGRNGNPLEHDEAWKKTQCPSCKGPALRETDTMDTFMDSSWYFFRFLDPKNSERPFEPELANEGIPVDIYVGGVEHAILHLLYARFITKFLASVGAWPKGENPKSGLLGEPFKQLITQGMVHGKTYTHPETGRFLRPDELDFAKLATTSAPYLKDCDLAAKVSYEKMSKSKHNGVDPANVMSRYGADVTRAHILFQAPVSDVLEWDEVKITGAQRWLKRVLRISSLYPSQGISNFEPPEALDDTQSWLEECLRAGLLEEPQSFIEYDRRTSRENSQSLQSLLGQLHPTELELLTRVHSTIASVTQSYTETYSLNTVVSDLMVLANSIWKMEHVSPASPVIRYMATMHMLRLAAPVAPAVAEEGWHILHTNFNRSIRHLSNHPLRLIRADGGPSIFSFGFPVASDVIMHLTDAIITCVVQINGKVRFSTKIRRFEVSPVSGTLDIRDAQEQYLMMKNEEVGHVLSELLRTDEGKEWFDRAGMGKLWRLASEDPGDNKDHGEFPNIVPPGWDVIVVQSGKVVNFIKRRLKSKSPTKDKQGKAT